MDDWSMFEADWPHRPSYQYPYYECYYKEPVLLFAGPEAPAMAPPQTSTATPARGDNPREIRNKAEKQRRDKLNQSIAELASMVPPVVASNRKIDKTGVLRLTAHYLRAHQYVFGDTIPTERKVFTQFSAEAVLGLLNGFLLTTTYRGLVVVVSQNMNKYLGYNELDLLGQSLFSIVHEEDHNMLREQLMPQLHLLGPNGELLVPDEPNGRKFVEDTLANDKRRFIVRFKKHGQRSEPAQYLTCHIEGSFRKSDRACRGYNRCCQVVRRARARCDNPCSSGNDVVFIGVVRPTVDTFMSESHLEAFRMEYRTRHFIDGEIIQCEHRIALVTGYMTHEVHGANAMNFMHKDDVQWVIIALREMYVKKRLFGESCYRLLTKNGQFIYMRTRGCLDVDNDSTAVTTFVCTNTVVGEKEGKYLIKLMKKKFMIMVKNNESDYILPDEEDREASDNEALAVKDPRLLEKDILHLVTDLPSTSTADTTNVDGGIDGPYTHRLAIIPHTRERIISAIDKIYSVIKNLPKEPLIEKEHSSLDLLNQSTQTDKVASIPKIKTLISPKKPMKFTTFEDTFMPQHSSTQSDFEETIPSTAIIDVDNYVFEKKTITKNAQDRYLGTGARPKQGTSRSRYNFTAPRPIAQSISFTKLTSVPISSNVRQIGIKRPIDCSIYESTLKKKSNEQEANPIDVSEQSCCNFETFLDEAISNAEFAQIDTALRALEQTIDPPFPDLLSSEVQEILEEIEDAPGERHEGDT